MEFFFLKKISLNEIDELPFEVFRKMVTLTGLPVKPVQLVTFQSINEHEGLR